MHYYWCAGLISGLLRWYWYDITSTTMDVELCRVCGLLSGDQPLRPICVHFDPPSCLCVLSKTQSVEHHKGWYLKHCLHWNMCDIFNMADVSSRLDDRDSQTKDTTAVAIYHIWLACLQSTQNYTWSNSSCFIQDSYQENFLKTCMFLCWCWYQWHYKAAWTWTRSSSTLADYWRSSRVHGIHSSSVLLLPRYWKRNILLRDWPMM